MNKRPVIDISNIYLRRIPTVGDDDALYELVAVVAKSGEKIKLLERRMEKCPVCKWHAKRIEHVCL